MFRSHGRPDQSDVRANQLKVAVVAVESFSRWIEQADQKAGFMAAGVGVLLAGVGAAQRQLAYSLHAGNNLGLVSLIVLGGFAFSLLVTGILIGRVLVPRFTSVGTNLLYFGFVRQLSQVEYAKQLLALDSVAQELALEAWDLAVIAHAKHTSVRLAIYSFGVSLLLFAAWVVLASTGLPAPP